MSQIQDHPSRFALANELHARLVQQVAPGSRAVYLVIARQEDGRDLEHLHALLDRHGAAHPPPGATHHTGRIGRDLLKWESHTEVTTFTVFLDGLGTRAFDPSDFEVFPRDWLADAPGPRLTSALVRVEPFESNDQVHQRARDWFVDESVCVSSVLGDAAVIAGDFRIQASGHVHFAIFPNAGTGKRRNGRILQRLCEIETYKSLSLLGFAMTQSLTHEIQDLDAALTDLVTDMTAASGRAEEQLDRFLEISAKLEQQSAATVFRFGATKAYKAIVDQRIAALREAQFNGLQTVGEFMTRRYDPAMRTVVSSEARLNGLAQRAMRAGELLRTQAEVERSAQSQAQLMAMNQRAATQLRMREMVEGVSVVAITYYAVSLLGYLFGPLAEGAGLGKAWLLSGMTLPVFLGVWLALRLIKRRLRGIGA